MNEEVAHFDSIAAPNSKFLHNFIGVHDLGDLQIKNLTLVRLINWRAIVYSLATLLEEADAITAFHW